MTDTAATTATTKKDNTTTTTNTDQIRLPTPNRWLTAAKRNTKETHHDQRTGRGGGRGGRGGRGEERRTTRSLPPQDKIHSKNTTQTSPNNSRNKPRTLPPTDAFRKYMQVDVKIVSKDSLINKLYSPNNGRIKVRKYIESKLQGVIDLPKHLLPYIFNVTHKGDSNPDNNGQFKRSFTVLFLSTNAVEHIYNVRRTNARKKKEREIAEKATATSIKQDKNKNKLNTTNTPTVTQSHDEDSASETSDLPQENNTNRTTGNKNDTEAIATSEDNNTDTDTINTNFTDSNSFPSLSPRSEGENVFNTITKGHEYISNDAEETSASHPQFWKVIDFFCKEKMWLDTSPITNENPDPTARQIQCFVPPCNSPNSTPHALLIGLPTDLVGNGVRQTRQINLAFWYGITPYLAKDDPWLREVNYNNSIGLKTSKSFDDTPGTSHFTFYVCNEEAGTKLTGVIDRINNSGKIMGIWGIPIIVSKIPTHGNDKDSWTQYTQTRKIQLETIKERNNDMKSLPFLRTNLIQGRDQHETQEKLRNLDYVLTCIPNYTTNQSDPTATIVFHPHVMKWMKKTRHTDTTDMKKTTEKYLINTLPKEIFKSWEKVSYRPTFLATNNPAGKAKTMREMAQTGWKIPVNPLEPISSQKQLEAVIKNNSNFDKTQTTLPEAWPPGEDEMKMMNMWTTDYETLISLDDLDSFMTDKEGEGLPPPTRQDTQLHNQRHHPSNRKRKRSRSEWSVRVIY